MCIILYIYILYYVHGLFIELSLVSDLLICCLSPKYGSLGTGVAFTVNFISTYDD